MSATVVLVHGAWHGPWCWEPLARELDRLALPSIAVDLPCEDPAAGLAQFAESILDAMAPVDGPITLVGHSLGGLAIALVAAERPVARLVYLCALLPAPGKSLRDQLAVERDVFVPGFDSGVTREADGRSFWADADAAVAGLYADLEPAVARAAVAQLRRQTQHPNSDVCPLTAQPSVPTTSIVARDDAAINPAWSIRATRERLGIEPTMIDGGHSPMLARPAELAALLASARGR